MGETRRPRLWVIDPSLACPETQGIAAITEGFRGDVRLFSPSLSPGDGPDERSGHDTDGVVLMGSAASVADDHPWLSPLMSWLDPVLSGAARIPLLGICFGHQAIAYRAGGQVGFLEANRTKRVGVEESRLTGSRLLPGVDRLRVVVSHREEVQSCPPGYRVVARRGPVAIDGLEHETLPIFAFQFHPEAGTEFAERVGIDSSQLDERLRTDSRMLLDSFRARVAAQAS